MARTLSAGALTGSALTAGALLGSAVTSYPAAAQTVPTGGSASSTPTASPWRPSAYVLGASLGSLPDAIVPGGCGQWEQSGGAGVTLGGSARWRPVRGLALDADAAVGGNAIGFGCDAMLRVRGRRLGPDLIEERLWGGYARETRTPAFVTTTLRAALETPAGAPRWVPLARASAGVGAFWPARRPFAVYAAALGTRGRRTRVFLELEHGRFGVDARERVTIVRESTDPRRQRVTLEQRVETARVQQAWTALRLGIERPWSAGR